jgi:hypothetical protein
VKIASLATPTVINLEQSAFISCCAGNCTWNCLDLENYNCVDDHDHYMYDIFVFLLEICEGQTVLVK